MLQPAIYPCMSHVPSTRAPFKHQPTQLPALPSLAPLAHTLTCPLRNLPRLQCRACGERQRLRSMVPERSRRWRQMRAARAG